jgi:hypothetical protein
MLISSYTTLKDAIQMDYPFVESIESMLSFSDEVCVLDSSIEKGTWEVLLKLQEKHGSKLRIHHENIDWSAPNHGIFDGKTKQLAREMCRGQYLFQFDCDEIIHENQASLIRPFIASVANDLKKIPIVALPVVEYWGRLGKTRIDINLWKWRISVRTKDIVHGIPIHLRFTDPTTGLEYSKPGSDSCDYISRATGERYPCISFVTKEIDDLRIRAITGDPFGKELKQIEMWFNTIVRQLPTIHHYSWFNIERKINQYKLFWTKFWKALYNLNRDERDNPIFPGKLWSEITPEMIKELAFKLETQTGGHIFHSPWNGEKTNYVRIFQSHPRIMNKWIRAHT